MPLNLFVYETFLSGLTLEPLTLSIYERVIKACSPFFAPFYLSYGPRLQTCN